MSYHSYPGFNEACAQEQHERNGAYLDLPSTVCGVAIRQMTPLDMARLTYARNPYLIGRGAVSHPVVAQFIFHLAVKPFDGVSGALAAVAPFTVDELDTEIEEYMDVTFRDQNGGGSNEDAPISCLAAWLEYRMLKTFGWDRSRTLNTPLRIIWQQLRCWMRENSQPVVNKLSGAVNAEFLGEIQRRIHDGTITQADIDKMNEASLRLQYGDAAIDAMHARGQN